MSRNTAETQTSFWQVNNFRSVEVHHEHKAGWAPCPPRKDRCELIIDSQLMTLIARDKLIKKEETKEEWGFFGGGGSFYVC